MNAWKRIVDALLHPHMAVMLLLTPVAIGALVLAMLCLEAETPLSVLSYVLSAYVLTVWCIRTPRIVAFWKRFKTENRFAVVWFADARLRLRVSLGVSLLWNAAYAALQLGLGIYHASFWFYTLAGYYALLVIMRFFLARYMGKYRPGECMRIELAGYRVCGVVFLGMNLVLSVMVFFMIYWGRSFHHHEITTIVLAAYTFTAFAVAIVNIVKYRKYGSPLFTASKAISLAAACVSMLTLTSTMLTTFGDGSGPLRRVFLGAIGAAVSVFIIAMAIYMIRESTKKTKEFQQEHTEVFYESK